MENNLYQMLKTDFEFRDTRGGLSQLVHQGWQQVNVLYTKAGVKRGGHYHEKTCEAFYVVSGSVTVDLSRGMESMQCYFRENDFFLIRPNVVHSLSFDEDCILVALYDSPVEKENGEKDIVPL